MDDGVLSIVLGVRAVVRLGRVRPEQVDACYKRNQTGDNEGSHTFSLSET
jgi:hypothetical protein